MSYLVHNYDQALALILKLGTRKYNDRTNDYNLWIPGIRSEYDLSTDRIPAISRRRLNHMAVVGELLWFINGSTLNRELRELGCNYWTPWVDKEWARRHGFLLDAFGPVYGFQLRRFGGNYGNGDRLTQSGGFDQLERMISLIKLDPSSRQNLWSLWDPRTLTEQKLPPCHMVYQVSIDILTKKLTGTMFQRSCDFPVGIPANILFYSLFTVMLAYQTGYIPDKFIHFTSDSHIYSNQLDAVKAYLETPYVDSPQYTINPAKDIYSYRLDDFEIEGSAPSVPNIFFPVAV